MENLGRQIVNSRRLLSDHVEILELSDINRKSTKCQTNIFAFPQAVGLTIFTALTAQYIGNKWTVLRALAPVVAGSYGICYAIKSINGIRNRLMYKRLSKLIDVLNRTDAAIRRTISFLREVRVLKSDVISSVYER